MFLESVSVSKTNVNEDSAPIMLGVINTKLQREG